jgi:major histocompatibility complex class I
MFSEVSVLIHVSTITAQKKKKKEKKKEKKEKKEISPHYSLSLGVVVHAFHSSTREAEAGGSLSSRPAWSTK